MRKEFEIGEEIQVGLLTVTCVEEKHSFCDGCIANDLLALLCDEMFGNCSYKNRKDKKNVIFIKKKEDENA